MIRDIFKYQIRNSVGLPYESLITKFLVKATINLDNEITTSTSRKIGENLKVRSRSELVLKA